MFKLPSTLPLALDSYRFLGGGATEENYVLFSDYFLLNDDKMQNKFTLGKQSNAKTYVRMYIEDTNIQVSLICSGKTISKAMPGETGAFLATPSLPKGEECHFVLVHKTDNHLKKQVWL
jgi:hypothetical protein